MVLVWSSPTFHVASQFVLSVSLRLSSLYYLIVTVIIMINKAQH